MNDTKQTASVHGYGAAQVPPDAATIALAVSEIRESVSHAQQAAAEKMGKAIAAIDRAGIAKADVRTDQYSLQALRTYDRETSSHGNVYGYSEGNSIKVTVRDLSKLPSLLRLVAEAGVTEVNGPSFFSQDAEAARALACERAALAARMKAEHLARPLGREIGRALRITETEAYGRRQTHDASYLMAESNFASLPDPEIESGLITIEFEVDVVFELV